MEANRKQLFVQINLPKDVEPLGNLLNNWTRPIPQEFHLVNSPSLTYQLASLSPHQNNRRSLQFFPENSKTKTKLRRNNKDRDKYKRFGEQLTFLQEFLKDFKDLKESQLLGYKQKLLVQYLMKFISEIETQCYEKAEFLRKIWNVLISIFNELFNRVIAESKKKECKYLKEEIATHTSYQAKLQEFKAQNNDLKQSEQQYQVIIKQFMTNIAKMNQQLRGQRVLLDKTSQTLKDIMYKYEELRAEHIEMLVNGAHQPLKRSEAEALLADKETLLFAKRIGDAVVKTKKKKERKAIKVNHLIDVSFLLEEIQAEEQYSFQIDCDQKKPATMISQKVQTINQRCQRQNAHAQCDYFTRAEHSLVRDKISQTIKEEKVAKISQSSQFIKSQMSQSNFKAERVFCINIYPVKEVKEDVHQSIKVVYDSKESVGRCSFRKQENKKCQMEDAFTEISNHYIKDQIKSVEIKKQSLDSLHEREPKMVKTRSIKNQRSYMQRIAKTEANVNDSYCQQSTSLIKQNRLYKKPKEVRKSSFLIIENLKQNIFKKVSNFKKQKDGKMQKLLRNRLIEQFQPGRSIKDAIELAFEAQECIGEEHHQNLQLSKLNDLVQQKLISYEKRLFKKVISGIVAPHKCIKGISEIFKLAHSFLLAGCLSVNLIELTSDYMNAIEGKMMIAETKSHKTIDFIKSCEGLYTENYLVRNYFLLCGLEPPSGEQRYVKMSKISMDAQQRIGIEKMLRNSIQLVKTEEPNQPYTASLVYYSEVKFYFQLLEQFNCSENKDDPSKFFTTFQRVVQVLPSIIVKHYHKGLQLIGEISFLVERSVVEWGNQNQSKLNIYKCLQLIIQKVLSRKHQIVVSCEPILKYYLSSNCIISDFLFLTGISHSQFFFLTEVAKHVYPKKPNISDIATLFLIQGLNIELKWFGDVEKSHKSAILKKLISTKSDKQPMLAFVNESLTKKMLKKEEFYLLLRRLWIKSSQRLFQQILGPNLLCLFESSLWGNNSGGSGFHRALHDKDK